MSFPIVLKQISFINSGITGFTLPGMMEEPGWSAGRLISKIPVRGPDARNIRSLEIFDMEIAMFLSAEEYMTKACILEVAAIRSLLSTIGLPVILARCAAHFSAYPGVAVIPVPIAVAPIFISYK